MDVATHITITWTLLLLGLWSVVTIVASSRGELDLSWKCSLVSSVKCLIQSFFKQNRFKWTMTCTHMKPPTSMFLSFEDLWFCSSCSIFSSKVSNFVLVTWSKNNFPSMKEAKDELWVNFKCISFLWMILSYLWSNSCSNIDRKNGWHFVG